MTEQEKIFKEFEDEHGYHPSTTSDCDLTNWLVKKLIESRVALCKDEPEFAKKFTDFQDEYCSFLDWCMDNNGRMTQEEWDEKRSTEFKRRGLDVFFK